MEMNRTKRSVVLVIRRRLMRAKLDLELVSTVYSLIRLVIEVYAARAFRGLRARKKFPLGTTESVAHDSGHRLKSISLE
jgi:hypothetical protein